MRLVAVAGLLASGLLMVSCGGGGGSDASERPLTTSTRPRETTTTAATTTEAPTTTTTVPLTPEQELVGRLGQAWMDGTVEADLSQAQELADSAIARQVSFVFADPEGYHWSSIYGFAMGNFRKVTADSPPGKARLSLDAVISAETANSTQGRDSSMPLPGQWYPLFQGTDDELGRTWACDVGAFASEACFIPGLTLKATGPDTQVQPVPGPAGQAVRNESGVVNLVSEDLNEAAVDRLVAGLEDGSAFLGFELIYDTGQANPGAGSGRADTWLTFDASGAEIRRCSGSLDGSGSPVDLCFAGEAQ